MAWIQTGATIIFKPYSLEQALEGVAEAGFENVEIGAVKGFLEHLDPDDLGPDSVRRTQALLDRHGLRCVSLSGHAPLHVEDGVRRLRNVLQAGRELRVLVVNTYTGDAETPEQRAAFVEQIRAIPTRPRKPRSGSASRPTRTCCPPPRSGPSSSTRSDIRGCR